MFIQKNIVIPGLHNKPIGIDVYSTTNAQTRQVVIFAHGFKGFKDWGAWDAIAKCFAQAGFVFVKFNFSHNGTTINNPCAFDDLEAFGNNNFSIELDDLQVVIDWVYATLATTHAFNVNKLHLIGHSRGGAITILQASTDKRVHSLCTWASVCNFGRYWQNPEKTRAWKEKGVRYILNGRTKQQMPMYWQIAENYNNNLNRLFLPDAIKAITIPFLIVHGTNDTAVYHTEGQQIHDWNDNSVVHFIEGANHVFGTRHPWNNTQPLPPHALTLVNTTIAFFKQ